VAQFLENARKRPELVGVSTTYTAATQQLFVDLDRSKAEALGVPVSEAFATMQAFFGSQIAGQFSAFSRVWWVILQADARYRMNPSDFDKVFVRARTGAMVPLSSLIVTRYVASPKLVTRFNGFPAVKFTGSQAPGYSSGQAIAAMEDVARELPGDFSYAWSGQALQEKESGSTSSAAFVFGLIIGLLAALVAFLAQWDARAVLMSWWLGASAVIFLLEMITSLATWKHRIEEAREKEAQRARLKAALRMPL
jgi:multidrug efflux pump